MEDLTAAERQELLDDLEAARADLAAQIEHTAAGAKPVDLEEPIGRLSRMDAMQQQNMLAANRRAAMQRHQQVLAALARMSADEYGECQRCGEPIDFRRLKASPESPFCVICQEQRERRV